VAAAAAMAVCGYAAYQGLDWALLQYALAAVITFDVVGGVVTNATPSAKRWYHRAGQGFRQHFGFVAGHVVQVALIALAFRFDDALFYGLIVYGYVVMAAAAVLRVPLKLQRSVALLGVCGAVFVAHFVLGPTPALEWFLPLLTLKLLVSHLTVEEPYTD
jgi:hypothetical protein